MDKILGLNTNLLSAIKGKYIRINEELQILKNIPIFVGEGSEVKNIELKNDLTKKNYELIEVAEELKYEEERLRLREENFKLEEKKKQDDDLNFIDAKDEGEGGEEKKIKKTKGPIRGTMTKENLTKKEFQDRLTTTKTMSGLLFEPSEILGVDTLLYYETKRKEDLTNLKERRKKMKKDIDGYDTAVSYGDSVRHEGLKEKTMKAYDLMLKTLDEDIETKDIPNEEKKLIADEILKLEYNKQVAIIKMKYPFLELQLN